MGIFSEELKVSAPVENIKPLLVLSRSEDVRRQSGSSSNHLHEFDFGTNLLEEDQVQNVGYINACVKHINRHGYLWVGIAYLQFVFQVLGVGNVVVNQHTEVKTVFRIKLVEAFHNLFCVEVVIGEYHSLSDTFSTLHFKAVLHQVLQHLVDGVLVEDIGEHLTRINVPGLSFILPYFFKLFFFFVGQLVVLDALFQNQTAPFQSCVWNQESVGNGLVKLVSKVRVAVFKFQQVVGAAFNLVPRRGGQANQEAVEVFEYGSILAEHASVSLVDDNHVELAYRKLFGLSVDVVYHRLVGREHYPGVGVLVALVVAEYAGSATRQQFDKILVCLIDQHCSVGQEQHILDPSVAHQHIHQRDGYTGLACSRSHNQQRPTVHSVEMLTHLLDCRLLICSVSYRVLDLQVLYATSVALLD